REQDDPAAARRIDPERAAGEAEVADAVLRPQRARRRARRRRAVPAEAPGRAGARREHRPDDAILRAPSFGERARGRGDVARARDRTGVAADAAAGAAVLVEDHSAEAAGGGGVLRGPRAEGGAAAGRREERVEPGPAGLLDEIAEDD